MPGASACANRATGVTGTRATLYTSVCVTVCTSLSTLVMLGVSEVSNEGTCAAAVLAGGRRSRSSGIFKISRVPFLRRNDVSGKSGEGDVPV